LENGLIKLQHYGATGYASRYVIAEWGNDSQHSGQRSLVN